MKTLIVEAKGQKDLATVQAGLKGVEGIFQKRKVSYDQYISGQTESFVSFKHFIIFT